MGAGEIRETLRFVRAFCAFRKDHMANEVRPLAHSADLITTWTEDGDGCWTKGEDEFSPMLPVAVTLDENLVRKVAALKVQKHVFLGKGLRKRLLRFHEGCIRGAFEPFVWNVVSHQRRPAQKHRSIPQHCANHRIINHRINRAYCHPTIGFRHTKTPFSPHSDAPLSGCSVVRMGNVRMTAPHRKRPAQCSALSFGIALIIGSSFIGSTGHSAIRPSVFAIQRHPSAPIRMLRCPVARLFGWGMIR